MTHSRSWREYFRIRGPNSIYIYSLLIGVVSGLGAVAFSYGIALGEYYTFSSILGIHRPPVGGELHFYSHQPVLFNPYLVFLFPILGGLVNGLFIRYISADVAGTGTDNMIHSFHNKDGVVSGWVPLFKSIATIITLSMGGSAGKEGPTAQIGSGFGSSIAGWIGAGARARRTLLLAGTAGGLGAIFRAPFGGALTAVEVIYREDIESDSLLPAIISSVTAYLVFTSIMGQGAVFDVGPLEVTNLKEILLYVALGLVSTAGGYLFVKIFRKVEKFTEQVPIHPVFKPALGGVVVGAIGVAFPEAIGAGFGIIQSVIHGESPIERISSDPHFVAGAFLLIAVLKIITTSFTVGTGSSGGVFGPSIFIGGMLGGFVGTSFDSLFPELKINVTAFILVGMASFFAGVANAPVASMIMVSDMAGSYKLLPALMIVSIISVILSHKWSIYKGQVKNRFESPAHYWDMRLDLLDRLHIKDHIQEYGSGAIVPRTMLLSELEEKAIEFQASDYVVVNSNNQYEGMISLRQTRLSRDMELIRNLIQVGEVCNNNVPGMSPDDTLGEALRNIVESEMDKVPVVDEGKVIGYVRYTDIFHIYTKHVGVGKPEQKV